MRNLICFLQSKRIQNPEGIEWTDGIFASGLQADSGFMAWTFFADMGFAISPKQCRHDNFPGTIVYYYEITKMSIDWM
jgi:hypothetical protein